MTGETAAKYDVAVVGGGAGGVSAAPGAAKTGARVFLIEKYGFLGGAATTSQVLSYCGFFHRGGRQATRSVAGVGEEIIEELRNLGMDGKSYHSETTGNWIILLEPERVKLALDRICARHGIDVLLHSRLASAERDGATLRSIEVESMAGTERIAASAFVDGSGDAVLAHAASMPCRIGDGEGRLNACTMPIRVGGLQLEGRVDRESVKRAVIAYNAEAPEAMRVHRDDGGIYVRIPGSRDFWWMIIDREMPDLGSRAFTSAEQSAREMAERMTEALRAHVPGFTDCYLVQTGPQIGIRESRHPAARYQITHADVIGGRLREDSIARGSWPIELHGEAGRPEYESVGGEGYFSIPMDAITASGVDNLWYAGRVIGADTRAYGSIRVMGTALASGHAAGVSAALAAQSGKAPDLAEVRARLIEQGALI